MINFYALSALINGLTSSALGILVYLQKKSGSANKSYGITTIFIGIWSYGYFFWQISTDSSSALFWCRALMIGAIYIPPAYLHFVLCLLGYDKTMKKYIIFNYSLASFFLIFDFTPLFVKNVSPKLFFQFWPEAGMAYLPFLILVYFNNIAHAIIIMFKELKKEKTIKRAQIKYVLSGAILGFGGGATNYFLWYNIPIPPIGNILISVGIGIMAYAIVRYRLMDIRLAITRFGIFTSVYALVLGIPFGIGWWGRPYLEKLGYHWWLIPISLCALFATIGPFVYFHLEKRSKELLYKIEFKRYETLRKFSKTLLSIKELDQLTKLIVYRLVKTLKVKFAGIYLYDKKNNTYLLRSYRPLMYQNVPKEGLLPKDDSLIKLLFIWRKELIQEEVENLPLSQIKLDAFGLTQSNLGQICKKMKQMSATLIIPHFIDDDLLGFLVLGNKENNAIYTEEDISTLSSLSNSAALAIENALFLIDLKITQAELFNAKRIAELGYMASAMGHEINNRLQAIYNASFDISDNPAIADIIKNNPDAKKIFDRDIQHINENIDDATAIINELKTYSKPQETSKQRFELLNLKDIVDKALTIVKLQSVKAFEMIELEIFVPSILPKVQGNFIQLQQVFVNILNNAHDAIIERKNYAEEHPELKMQNYRGKIRIMVAEAKGSLNIHVLDNGIGMTDEIKKRLFIPLYTSKASADRKTQREMRGGTGIGLYTIQTIIRGHNGAISVYETERFKGTDFLITLPIART